MIDPIELHGLADGELAAEREAEIKRQLAECQASQAEFQSILAVKSALREKVAPLEYKRAWKGCVGRLNEIDRTHKIERLVSGRFAWGLCGVFFAAIIFAGYTQHGDRDPNQQSADLARLVGSLGPSKSADAASRALDKSMDDLLKKARVSIDPNRMEIMSRAYGDLDGRSVMRVTLRDASGDLALLVVHGLMPLDGLGELARDHAIKVGHVQDKRCVAWSDGANTLVLVGDRAYDDLATSAKRIMVH